MPRPTKQVSDKWDQAPGFDVTCLVGRVTFGDGDQSPYEAAFTLIGRHGGEGVYQFPAEDGGIVEVSVSHVDSLPRAEDAT